MCSRDYRNPTRSSRYFYDDEGSRLFQAIMNCRDYYPTNCEQEILESHGRSIVATCGNDPLNVIDLYLDHATDSDVTIEVDSKPVLVVSETVAETIGEQLLDLEETDNGPVLSLINSA